MIPLATTEIRIERLETPQGPYQDRQWVSRGACVRAVISSPSGSDELRGGEKEVIDATLLCDPTVLCKTDRVTDTYGNTYDVVWVLDRYGLGLEHVQAGLRKVEV